MSALYLPFLFPPWLFGFAPLEISTDMMTDTADEAAPKTGELFTLATNVKPPPPPHTFGPRLHVPPHNSPSGHEQHEWKCQCCQLFKITVLPRGQEAYRMYRFGKDGAQFEDEREPACQVLTDRGCRP